MKNLLVIYLPLNMEKIHESHDHFGNVTRVHPKMINGQNVQGQHYPPTKTELESFTPKPRGAQ